MNKKEFLQLLSNHNDLNEIYINIWNGFDDDNNDASWLEVFIKSEEYKSVYISDYFLENDENKKLLLKEQSKWIKKIKQWISTFNKEIKIIVSEENI